MATLTIRNLDDDVHARLRIQAAKNGNSVEAEVRDILAKSTKDGGGSPPENLGLKIHEIFKNAGGWDELELPPRLPPRDPPNFDE